ncbi:4'-phosphopantetheinyl transferase superfamily protein [Flavobacteriaceae bacterium F08102]|nr:4'-phosphopantetheinyl transferase superfamily protein [Flavobacteriaceae bacterium F08102]
MGANDIVDLAQNQLTRRRRDRFISKVFNRKEKQFLLASTEVSTKMWIYWAMKESGYKLSVQCGRMKRFIPLDFSCELINQHIGSVRVDQFHFKSFVFQTRDYVYCETYLNPSERFVHNVFESTLAVGMTSNELYRQLAEDTEKRCHFKPGSVQIKKNVYQIPQLYVNGKQQPIRVSLTHDGKFGAYLVSSL